MKRTFFLFAVIAVSFLFGFAFKTAITTAKADPQGIRKVTGIGGIFFKSKDPKRLKNWYRQHLGFNTDAYGTSFEWRLASDSSKKGLTQWAIFSDSTNYFQPSTKDFMINYRVVNLVSLVESLKREGVTIVDKMETYDYGKFIHVMDVDGNSIELWEPVEPGY